MKEEFIKGLTATLFVRRQKTCWFTPVVVRVSLHPEGCYGDAKRNYFEIEESNGSSTFLVKKVKSIPCGETKKEIINLTESYNSSNKNIKLAYNEKRNETRELALGKPCAIFS